MRQHDYTQKYSLAELIEGKPTDHLQVLELVVKRIFKELQDISTPTETKAWRPYRKWLALFQAAIEAELAGDKKRLYILSCYANCERYPWHLIKTLPI